MRVLAAPRVHRWNHTEYYKLAQIGLFDGQQVELIEGGVLDRYTTSDPHIHCWTSEEYYRMGEAGLLAGMDVELVEGQVIEMSPIGGHHAAAVTLADDLLREVFGAGYFVRIQNPLDLGALSQPQPDVAVVAGAVRDYVAVHPATAALIVEVADTSLTYDQTTKASLYAKASIADYWIVNLMDRQLEVYRSPEVAIAAPYAVGYRDRTIYTATEFVTPLARPERQVAVADLLP